MTDLAPLRFVRSITAPLSPLAARRFMDRFGVTVLNSYGQAEVGEVIGWTAADAREHPEKLGAAGRPHAGVDVKVVDEDGRRVADGEVGELLVRPPRMAAGYAGGADRSTIGWTRRASSARATMRGSTPRASCGSRVGRRTSSTGAGTRCSPSRWKRCCASTPGSPRPRSSPGPTIVWARSLSRSSSVTPTRQRSVALCREHLSPYKVPVAFHRAASLPRNEVGKLLRRQVVDELRRPPVVPGRN